MVPIKKVAKGKYYADDSTAVRIDGFNSLGDPEGASITFFDGCVMFYQDTNLEFHFLDDNQMEEISQAEFNERLQEAHGKFIEMINKELE